MATQPRWDQIHWQGIRSNGTGHSDQPCLALRRLLDVHRAHRELIKAGMAGDPATATAHVDAAAGIAPDDRVVAPLHAISTALSGDVAAAAPLLESAILINPATGRWARRQGRDAIAEGNHHGQELLDLVDLLDERGRR